METVQEWLTEFDLLYDNLSSGQAPGLNVYEKSLLCTRAQEDVILSLYNGTLGAAFESTELVTSMLSELVAQQEFSNSFIVSPTNTGYKALFDDCEDQQSTAKIRSYVFNITDSVIHPSILLVTFEEAVITDSKCGGSKRVLVVPATQDEIWRTANDPFRGPNRNRVIRLSHAEPYTLSGGTISGVNMKCVELISVYPIEKYIVRYIRRPDPIILGDIGSKKINGSNTIQVCKLAKQLHPYIVREAVRAAKAIWAKD